MMVMLLVQSVFCWIVVVEKFLFLVNFLEVFVVLYFDIFGLYFKYLNKNYLGIEFNMLENNNVNSCYKVFCNFQGFIKYFF